MPYRLKKSNKIGLPPGVKRYSGDIVKQEIKVEIINYQYRNKIDQYYQSKIPKEEILDHLHHINDQSITWVDIQGIHDEKLISNLAHEFNFHPILTEDLLSPQQRPKMDVYKDHLVFFLRRGFDDEETVDFETDQIAIVLGKNYVLSFNELSDDKFKKIKDMIDIHTELFTQYKNDFLAYIMMDFVVDTYFLEAEKLDADIELIEDQIAMHDFDMINENIRQLRKRNLGLKKIISPLRDIPQKLRKVPTEIFNDEVKLFLTDLEDHIYQLIEMVDSHRELIINLKESYATEISIRMNEIMMTLTVVSTILLPLTFLTSLYGMNFEYIPELTWRYSYFVLWVIMIVLTLIMTILFKRRKWL